MIKVAKIEKCVLFRRWIISEGFIKFTPDPFKCSFTHSLFASVRDILLSVCRHTPHEMRDAISGVLDEGVNVGAVKPQSIHGAEKISRGN